MYRVFGKSIVRRNRMIHWNLVIALTMVAVVLAAITELAESLIKGDKE